MTQTETLTDDVSKFFFTLCLVMFSYFLFQSLYESPKFKPSYSDSDLGDRATVQHFQQ